MRQKPLARFLGVEGMEPRTSPLDYTWLPARVRCNALIQTSIAVKAAF